MTPHDAHTTASSAYTSAAAGDQARDVFEQLLALSNQVGAAYMEAYEKTASGISQFQDGIAGAQAPGSFEAMWPAGMPGMPGADMPEPLQRAADQALELSDELLERSKKVTLAYLNACEATALAVADLQEQMCAASPLEFVKTVGGARATFTRQVTKACADTAREIVS